MAKKNGLLKIGQIAREARVPPSTIRYYTKLGLLEPAEVLPSGYRLYEPFETVKRVELIRKLLSQKPTLRSIRQQIDRLLQAGQAQS